MIVSELVEMLKSKLQEILKLLREEVFPKLITFFKENHVLISHILEQETESTKTKKKQLSPYLKLKDTRKKSQVINNKPKQLRRILY